MDNEFYTDNFEQLLKEQADRFTMQPTKRVWHSIYNDLHPARKWPSIAISCLLVISILLLGYFNTNNGGNQSASSSLANDAAGNTLGKQDGNGQQGGTGGSLVSGNDNTVASVAPDGPNASPSTATPPINSGITEQNVLAPIVNMTRLPRRTSRLSSVRAIQYQNKQQDQVGTKSQSTQRKPNAGHLYVVPPTVDNDAEQVDNNLPVSSDNNMTARPAQSQIKIAMGNTETITPIASEKSANNTNNTDGDNQDNEKTIVAKEQKTDLQKATAINYIDRAWIDDHAFYNSPRPSKLKNRLSWQVYITPSLTYRTLFENTIAEGRTTLQSLVTNPFVRQPGIENSVEHKPGPSIELGGGVAYQLAKKWQLKLGAQVNYTSYHATANNIQHPITTTIAMNDFTNGSLNIENRSATISNTPGSNNNKLNNYTVQLALPIGFAYKLAGNNDLKFFAGATLQPSFVLVGNSPLLSSDRLFYVENNTKQGDASLMRRFNVAMGIETYASFRMGEYTFLAGPQLRYQLLTTNSNKYTIGEKLYNIGVKLGISKKF